MLLISLETLVSPENIILVLVAVAVFMTLISLAIPYLETDKLNERIKTVGIERDKLKAQQKLMLAGNEARLREKPKKNLSTSLVEKFNLRHLLEADSTRTKLRQAGYRSEHHLVTFLTIRFVLPIALSIFVLIYTSLFYSDKLAVNTRLVLGIGFFAVGFYLPLVVLKNKTNRRQLSIKRSWSDALDLLLICVESGMAIEPSMNRVAREIGGSSVALAEELALTVAELSYLQDRRRAFENLGKRVGLPTVKSVVTSLIQAEQYGTPLGQALRVLAQENRDQRMSDAERKAAALPPKLTVPMIMFFLPVIFVVVLAPAVISLVFGQTGN